MSDAALQLARALHRVARDSGDPRVIRVIPWRQAGRRLEPTHTCFRDALEFAAAHPHWGATLAIIHALVPVEDHPDQLIVHAWAECADDVYHAGLRNGHRLYIQVPRDPWYRFVNPRATARYTIAEAEAERKQSGLDGPWLPAYRAYALSPNDPRLAHVAF